MRRGLLFGPLYSLFLLRPSPQAEAVPSGVEAWLEIWEAARWTPLEALLPPSAKAEEIGVRMASAATRLLEMDRLLVQPQFCIDTAQAKLRDLQRQGDTLAIGLLQLRLQQIHSLQQQRERLAADLEDVRELLGQLSSQVEAVRRTGRSHAGTPELIAELLRRLSALHHT